MPDDINDTSRTQLDSSVLKIDADGNQVLSDYVDEGEKVYIADDQEPSDQSELQAVIDNPSKEKKHEGRSVRGADALGQSGPKSGQ